MASEQLLGAIKLVGALMVMSLFSYLVIVQWGVGDRVTHWFASHINPADVTSVIASVTYQPKVGVGVNQSYGLIRIATNDYVKYKLTIEPKSCLSFDDKSSVYVIENVTTSTVEIPVYFRYTSTCSDLVYHVTLWIFSQKKGSYIKVQTLDIIPEFDYANIISVIPNGPTHTVFQSDLSDLANSPMLTDFSEHLKDLNPRGVLVINNLNFPIIVHFVSDGEVIYLVSNKVNTVQKLGPVSNYTLRPSEVILILPTLRSSLPISYFVHLEIGAYFGGRYNTYASMTIQVLPVTGFAGVLFQNTTMVIPISKRSDYLTVFGHSILTTSKDYAVDAFGFGVFDKVPDLDVVAGHTSTSAKWVLLFNKTRIWKEYKATFGEKEELYAYKPDLDKYGISREYIYTSLTYYKSTTDTDGAWLYKYKVKTAMFFNDDSRLKLFASSVSQPTSTNALISAIKNSLFGLLFDSDWPEDRALLVTVPTFIVGVNTARFDIKKVSVSVKTGNYSIAIYQIPYSAQLTNSSIDKVVKYVWNVPEPNDKKRNRWTITSANIQPGVKAYTFVPSIPGTSIRNEPVIWLLLGESIAKGYYTTSNVSAVIGTRGDYFPTYFGLIQKGADGSYYVQKVNDECKPFSSGAFDLLDNQWLGCYHQNGDISTTKIKDNTYIMVPVKLLITYHQDFPDKTTGVMGEFCSGAGGVMLEREDMLSMLAPWTELWCGPKSIWGHQISSGDDWDGKKANQLLALEVKFDVYITVEGTVNVIGKLKYRYAISYDLLIYLPLLTPYWDSNYIFYKVANK